MTDEKRYTEREKVMAQRIAFQRGAEAVFDHFDFSRTDRYSSWEGSAYIAAARYPLPTVTRPRVVTDDSGTEFRVNDEGNIEGRKPFFRADDMREWGGFCQWDITAERVALWADLLANPTEEVDA